MTVDPQVLLDYEANLLRVGTQHDLGLYVSDVLPFPPGLARLVKQSLAGKTTPDTADAFTAAVQPLLSAYEKEVGKLSPLEHIVLVAFLRWHYGRLQREMTLDGSRGEQLRRIAELLDLT